MAAKSKYPKALGAAIDLLYEQRAARLALQKKVDEMKVDEADLADHILNSFTKEELNGSKGKLAVAAIKHTTTVNTTDWDVFLAYCVKTKSWDMLRKQPTVAAVKARWDAGKEVPGVEPFIKIDLSLTKA
jgi:hypothetical protein